jgi:hypothetical protein
MRASPPSGDSRGSRRLARWPGLIFGGLGFAMFAGGAALLVERLVVLQTWKEADARVTVSQVEESGSQLVARILVEFDAGGRRVVTEPASDYRSSNYGWIARTVDRLPVGADVSVRYNPDDPTKARLEVGLNFNTIGTPLLLGGAGLVFWGVGALALRAARLEAAGGKSRDPAELRRLDRARYLGMAAFIGVIGFSFLFAAAVTLEPAIEKRRWPAVDARVERTDIFTRSSSYSHKRRAETFYVGRVFLAYKHGGRSWNSAIDLPGSSTDRETIEEILAGFRPGDAYPVRLNPANPHELSDIDAWPLILPLVFGSAGLVLVGVALLLVRSAPRTGSPRPAFVATT